jgi:hypothetical protein
MSPNDLACVKTQKFEKCRELFFSDEFKASRVQIASAKIALQTKRSFYRGCAPLRFYTAKTQSGHERTKIAVRHSTDAVTELL